MILTASQQLSCNLRRLCYVVGQSILGGLCTFVSAAADVLAVDVPALLGHGQGFQDVLPANRPGISSACAQMHDHHEAAVENLHLAMYALSIIPCISL